MRRIPPTTWSAGHGVVIKLAERKNMPELRSPFSRLANDGKLTDEELVRAIRFSVSAGPTSSANERSKLEGQWSRGDNVSTEDLWWPSRTTVPFLTGCCRSKILEAWTHEAGRVPTRRVAPYFSLCRHTVRTAIQPDRVVIDDNPFVAFTTKTNHSK